MIQIRATDPPPPPIAPLPPPPFSPHEWYSQKLRVQMATPDWFKQDFFQVENKDTIKTSWVHQIACGLYAVIISFSGDHWGFTPGQVLISWILNVLSTTQWYQEKTDLVQVKVRITLLLPERDWGRIKSNEKNWCRTPLKIPESGWRKQGYIQT